MWRLVVMVGLLSICNGQESNYRVQPNFGPRIQAPQGTLWPKPQQMETSEGFLVIRPSVFRFELNGDASSQLRDAAKRYYRILFESLTSPGSDVPQNVIKTWKKEGDFLGYLDSLKISIEEISVDNEEAYELEIGADGALLKGSTDFGILRGLETFSQLAYVNESSAVIMINPVKITDFPRFNYRGLLLDTSRHYFPVSDIKLLLDAMSYNKLNVFHWHIVDDQSFPFQSARFPSLSDKGAYHPLLVYSREDVLSVIYYANLRGIKVIPEFDSPGHTLSWGAAYPELLTPCYKDGKPDGTFGPMNPTLEFTFTFFWYLIEEVNDLFKANFVHLGGDEVPFGCWMSNPNITEFMKEQNITSYPELESYYIQRIVDITQNFKTSVIVWQEVFDNKVNLQKDAIVHIWKGDEKGQMDELGNVTAAGYSTILSTCWYLDSLQSGGDWQKYYKCEPQNFNGTEEQKKLVIGGEACMWAESVNHNNVHQRIWPRASAAAERLWSAADVTDIDDASLRLEEHACRMSKRGVPAQPPNGPGFCV